MNSHTLILKSLQPVVCRVNTRSDEYEEEQPGIITDNLFCQLKNTALLEDATSATLPDNHIQANNNENLIENFEEKASEQPCNNSPFKLPKLTLWD